MHPVQDMNVQPPSATPPSGGPGSDEDQHCANVVPERLPAAGGQAQVLLPSGKGSRRFFRGGVIAAGALVGALLVAGLAASVQSRFFRHQDGEVCCGLGSEDDEKTDDSTADSGRVLCFAEMRRLAAKAIRVQEPLRRQRLRACAAPYPDEVILLVEEAYEAAKRHAERRAVEWNPCMGGTLSGLCIIEVQEQQCEDVVAFIERVCNRQLAAPSSTHDAEQNTFKEDPYCDYPGREPETAHRCLVSLMTRLLPDMPYKEVKRSVNGVLRPVCMADQFDYIGRDSYPSRYLIKDEYPFRTVQCWAAPAHAQRMIEEQKRDIRRLELRARQGERQSLEQILDLLVFNPRSFFTADPVLANEIYESAKMANPNLRLSQEPQIQLVLFLSANTPSGWGDHRAYPEEEGVNLDLWGDGEPGYLISLAWHYAHDPAFRWDIFQRILVRSGGGLDCLLANLRRAYLYAQENDGMGPDGDLGFFSYDLGIDFASPREIRRWLAYYERKRLERCKYPELYEKGVRFIALQVANEEVLANENSPLDRAHQENALRQDMAIDLACIGETMLSPVPADAHQTREEYRRLCVELSALLVAKKSDKAPTAAAFQATQQAWTAYCRLFEDVIPENDLVPEDDWRVWLLEKRILQLRRMKYRMLGSL
ncbi:hypothetical protein [Oligosphaera ethanolica]|uniref:Lysozyme inhibitor LprI N-terminal domain-containing protein n=1 Tax=Oligosphaera ethanolica TaxID=760260 RepID=A0AAE3VHI5_9BACT|nr:hypothetical protein [Oligosphaera ethanolica]MDQ0290540.1 hypothetical protein [Oligosphaera ethanolica]